MSDATKPPPRRRMSGEARAEQLLDIADALFTAQGFDDTSIEDIARNADVTRPIVYQHFGDKEGVFLACLERARRSLRVEFAPLFDGTLPPDVAAIQAAETWFDIVERDPARWKIFFSNALPLTGSLSERIDERVKLNEPLYVDALTRWLPEDVSPEVTEVVAAMITGTADELARWWLAHPHVPKRVIIDTLITFCMAGVSPWRDDVASPGKPAP